MWAQLASVAVSLAARRATREKRVNRFWRDQNRRLVERNVSRGIVHPDALIWYDSFDWLGFPLAEGINMIRAALDYFHVDSYEPGSGNPAFDSSGALASSPAASGSAVAARAALPFGLLGLGWLLIR